MLRTATLTFNSATPEHVINQIATTSLPAGGKFDQRYPGAREAILKGIEHYGNAYPKSQWGWEWFANVLKKDIVPRIFTVMDPQSYENKKIVDELQDQINGWRAVQEMPDAGDMTIHYIHEDGQIETLERQIRNAEQSISTIYANAEEKQAEWAEDPMNALFVKGTGRAYQPSSVFASLANLKDLTDCYHIPVSFGEMKTLEDFFSKYNTVRRDTQEREREREVRENFASGRYAWDETEPLYKFQDGWAVWPVGTVNDLELEGELMDHCIGNPNQDHLNRISGGNSSAISLRDPSGIPHATAELSDDASQLDSLYGYSDHHLNGDYTKRMEEYFKHSPLSPHSRYWSGDKSGGNSFDNPFEGWDEDDEPGEVEVVNETDNFWDDNDLQPPSYRGNSFDFLRGMIEWKDKLDQHGEDISQAANDQEWIDTDHDMEDDYGRTIPIIWHRPAVDFPFGWREGTYDEFIQDLFYQIAHGEEAGQVPEVGEIPYEQNDEYRYHRSAEELYDLARGWTYLEDLLQSSEHWSSEQLNAPLNQELERYPGNKDLQYFMEMSEKTWHELEGYSHDSFPHQDYIPGQQALLDQDWQGDWEYENEDPEEWKPEQTWQLATPESEARPPETVPPLPAMTEAPPAGTKVQWGDQTVTVYAPNPEKPGEMWIQHEDGGGLSSVPINETKIIAMAHTAASGTNWVYLNGKIKSGLQPHYTLLTHLGEDLVGEPELGQVANMWAGGQRMPKGIKYPIARGIYDRRGQPAIWESNVDRNSVYTEVLNNSPHPKPHENEWDKQITTEPRRYEQMVAGYSETAEEMYGKIQSMGWNVVGVNQRAGQWVVVIQNAQGSKVERTGNSQERALGSALTWAWQHSHFSARPETWPKDWKCPECGAGTGRDAVYEAPEGGFECFKCGAPAKSQVTLARVFGSLRPNADDGNHFGVRAHSLQYSYDDMMTFLTNIKRDEVTPGWREFKRAAEMAYLSRDWRAELTV